jgi:hypothetical protein
MSLRVVTLQLSPAQLGLSPAAPPRSPRHSAPAPRGHLGQMCGHVRPGHQTGSGPGLRHHFALRPEAAIERRQTESILVQRIRAVLQEQACHLDMALLCREDEWRPPVQLLALGARVRLPLPICAGLPPCSLSHLSVDATAASVRPRAHLRPTEPFIRRAVVPPDLDCRR